MPVVIKLHVWDSTKTTTVHLIMVSNIPHHEKHKKMCREKSSDVEDVRVMGLTCTFTSDTSNSRVTLFLQTLTGKIQKKVQQT
jgi:hypothetical protein